MKKLAIGICGLFGMLIVPGCQVPSRVAMYGPGGRTSYNTAAQNTTNQELLLNLVRLRYSDTPYFLELGGITTQYNVSGKVSPSFTIPGFNSSSPVKVGADLGWSNQPTIQYSPLEGKDFAVQLMQPLDLRVVQDLLLTGWDVDRVFRLLIQNMADLSNATSASGPIPFSPPKYKRFFTFLSLLKHFQSTGELQVGMRHIPFNNDDSKSSDEKKPNTIQISFPVNDERSHQLANLLEGVKRSEGRYVIDVRQAFNENAEIGVLTRSLLGTMYYLSLGVHVPEDDIQSGVVALTKNPDGSLFDWNQFIGDIFNIKCSTHYPHNTYLAIPYRGYWFYIDDTDVKSKRTFVLLQQVYNLQSKQTESDGPILTIPLGSRQ